MKEAAFFRLLVRGIGVYILAVSGLPSLVSLVQFVYAAQSPPEGPTPIGYMVIYSIWYLISPVIGVYLLFFADGLIRRCLLDAANRCSMCGRDGRGIADKKCPDCGGQIV